MRTEKTDVAIKDPSGSNPKKEASGGDGRKSTAKADLKPPILGNKSKTAQADAKQATGITGEDHTFEERQFAPARLNTSPGRSLRQVFRCTDEWHLLPVQEWNLVDRERIRATWG